MRMQDSREPHRFGRILAARIQTDKNAKEMIRFLWLIAALCLGMSAEAQTTVKRLYPKEDKTETTQKQKKTRAERQAEKLAQEQLDSVNYVRAVQALEDLDFVLEADRLIFKRGTSAFVSPITNFVSLHNDEATVQVAPFNSISGPNGVGGVTVEGTASNIQIKTDKKGTSIFSMSVMGKGISATVVITLPKGSNNASVTVNPNFNSNRITLNGVIIPGKESKVFQGVAF